MGILDAPCKWCGYSGERYWQAGSHKPDCPWHEIGSGQEREFLLKAHYSNMSGEEARRALEKLAQWAFAMRNGKPQCPPEEPI